MLTKLTGRLSPATLPALALVLMMLATGPWFVDDAGIVFAYSRSIATGLGPTTGASPDFVEGFSDPAWVLILATLRSVGLPIEWCAKAIGGFGMWMACWTVLNTARQEGLPQQERWALGVSLALIGPMWLWALSGLENGLWAWMLVASVCVKHRLWASVAVVVLMWVRPEAPLVMVGVLASRAVLGHSWKLMAGVAIASTVALFGIRLLVFDAWWPNTAEAKLDRGLLSRVIAGIRYSTASAAWLGWVPLALGAYTADRSAPHRRLPLYAAGPFAASLLAMLYMGGDWMRYGRFLVGLSPLIALACAPALLANKRTRWVLGTSWVVCGLVWADVVRRPPLPMSLVQEVGDVVAAITQDACRDDGLDVAVPDVGGILWGAPELTVNDLAQLTTVASSTPWSSRLEDSQTHIVITHGPWVQRTGLTPTTMEGLRYAPLCVRPAASGVAEQAHPTTLFLHSSCDQPMTRQTDELVRAWCSRPR